MFFLNESEGRERASNRRNDAGQVMSVTMEALTRNSNTNKLSLQCLITDRDVQNCGLVQWTAGSQVDLFSSSGDADLFVINPNNLFDRICSSTSTSEFDSCPIDTSNGAMLIEVFAFTETVFDILVQ